MMTEQQEFDAKRNLIVNYLPHSLSEEDVKELFSRDTVPSKVRLMKDPTTGHSLSYAFIEFPDEQSASLAISQIDGMKMQDKTIKVSYARKSSPQIKNTNIYISGLPQWVTDSDLLEIFTPYGEVVTHKLLTNQDKSSKGVGFVRYSYNHEAEKAIEAMNTKVLPNATNPLVVKVAIPAAAKHQQQALNNPPIGLAHSQNIQLIGGRSLNVRYNPLAVSNQLPLTQIAHVLPPPPLPTATIDRTLMQNGLTNQLQAYNVLSQQAVQAQTQIQTQDQQQAAAYSLYVYGLQAHHNELTLYELFAPFGGIINVRLIRDLQKEERPCKGFGFVNFRKYDEAYNAVLSMNNRVLENRSLQVSFKTTA